MIEVLTKLSATGDLKKLICSGLMSTKVLTHYEIYMEFDRRKKLNHKTVDIVFDLSDIFKISVTSIYAIIKKFK